MESLKTTGLFIAIVGAVATSGCSGVVHKKSALGTYNYLSIDAKQRLITSKKLFDADRNTDVDILCSEPSPNAFVARAAAAAASGSRPVTGGAASASAGAGSAESASALGARTQTIELIRDAYYRACEGYANGIVDKAEYQSIVANVDSTMIALAAIDALGGATLAANNVITSPGVSVTAGVDANGKPVVVQTTPGSHSAANALKADAAGVAAANSLKAIALYSLANSRSRTDRISAAKLIETTGMTSDKARAFVQLADKLNHQGHADKFLLKTGGGITTSTK